MTRIELITAAGVEVLAYWPASDPDTVEALTHYYRDKCKGDEGFVTVRARLVPEKEKTK